MRLFVIVMLAKLLVFIIARADKNMIANIACWGNEGFMDHVNNEI